MDNFHPESTLVDRPRKFACVRCRFQKLRCERDSLAPDGDCRRCLKAGVRCISAALASNTFSRPPRARRRSSTGLSSPSAAEQDFLSAAILNMPARTDAPAASSADKSREEMTPTVRTTTDSRPPSIALMTSFDPPLPELDPSFFEAQNPNLALSQNQDMATLLSSSENSGLLGLMQPLIDQETDWLDGEYSTGTRRQSEPSSNFFARGFELPTPLSPPTSQRNRNHPSPSPLNTRHHSDQISARRRLHKEGQQSTSAEPSWNARFCSISAVLLEDLSLIESGKVAGTLVLSSTQQRRTYSSTANREAGHQHCYTIGQILGRSEDLLHALQEVCRLSSGKVVTQNDISEIATAGDMEGGDGSGWVRSESTDSGGDARRLFLQSGSSRCPSPSRKVTHKTIDPILALLIMTCYTSLLRIYKGIFSLIHDSTKNQTRVPRSSFFPALPDIRCDGFNVGGRRDLQTGILLQISSDLIQQVDKVMDEIWRNVLAEGGVPRLTADMLSAGPAGETCSHAYVVELRESLDQTMAEIRRNLGKSWEG